MLWCRRPLDAFTFLPLCHTSRFCTLWQKLCHLLLLCDWSCLIWRGRFIFDLPGLSFGNSWCHLSTAEIGCRLYVSLLRSLFGQAITLLLLNALSSCGIVTNRARGELLIFEFLFLSFCMALLFLNDFLLEHIEQTCFLIFIWNSMSSAFKSNRGHASTSLFFFVWFQICVGWKILIHHLTI